MGEGKILGKRLYVLPTFSRQNISLETAIFYILRIFKLLYPSL